MRETEGDHVPVIDGRTWLEHLPKRECFELLSVSAVGRIGVLVDSAPEIYPVNFVVDDHTIVFKTNAGSKLRGLVRSPTVCFEADGFNHDEQVGWSVLVKGRAEEVRGPEETSRVEQLPLRIWTTGEKVHWIRIRPGDVTGRRIRPSPDRGPGPTRQGR